MKEKSTRKPAAFDTIIYGKVPPQAQDLEAAVLGAALQFPAAYEQAAEILKPECFYADKHKMIFDAMRRLQEKAMPIDELTVAQELRAAESLDLVGGAFALTELTRPIMSAANTETHARIIMQKFLQREAISLAGNMINEAYSDGCDVFDLFAEHEKNLTALVAGHLKRNYQTIDRVILSALQHIDQLRQQDDRVTGVSSGFAEVDRITHGWQPGDLIILAARPSVGKTALALNFARNAALHASRPEIVGFFSLEMSAQQIAMRLLAAESGIPLEKILTGDIDDALNHQLFTRGAQPLGNSRMLVDDTPALTLPELRGKARAMKRKHNIGMIIVDYLQLMSGTEERHGNREQEISKISRGLKALAKELKVPLIALSQLSREPEKRKGDQRTPQLSDLRESGAIEQDADLVAFIYRPEYYEGLNEWGEKSTGETHITISKHRSGKLAKGREAIKLRADLSIQKFYDWDGPAPVPHASLNFPTGNWRPVPLPYKDNDDINFDDE